MDDFTYLEYIKDVSTHHNGKHVLVKCTLCDNEKVVSEYHFRKKNVKSCGCLVRLIPKRDYTGQTFNNILLLGYVCGNKYRAVFTCGHTGDIRKIEAENKACSVCTQCSKERNKKLLAERSFKHGDFNTREHTSWLNMKRRCYEPTHNRYYRYGGRGIKVCDRWLESYENFIEDMGYTSKGMSLDRIDLELDYSKDNCKWSTDKEQANNKSNNILIEKISTGEVMSLKHWSDMVDDGAYKRNHARIRYLGWPINKILGDDFKLIQF